jgi:hypothetical protein
VGFQFFCRIRIIPGVRLNLSRSGVSTSIGSRGAWYTFGSGRRRTTVGVPGSGLSYSRQVRTQHGDRPAEGSQGKQPSAARGFAWLLVLAVVVYVAVRLVRG